ncbi:hypothetical protein ACFXK0_02100 [Nocardia sp. NPDC059177]|uniref:hypothetical protein n=1 Tax=Nocardia sp. NPDC059177 TaxID=3346759 RepID=UPI00367F260E
MTSYPEAPGAPAPYPQAVPYPPQPVLGAVPLGAQYVPMAQAGPRVVPQNVQLAFMVMLAGAVVTLLGFAYTLTTLDQIRSDTLDASSGMVRGSDLDAVMWIGIGAGAVGTLISAGLWTWMAFACRAGKNWARITGSTFFGINVMWFLFGILSALVGTGFTVAHLFNGVGVAIGLAVVILLWTGGSGPYFAPHPPPGYQPYPGANGPW